MRGFLVLLTYFAAVAAALHAARQGSARAPLREPALDHFHWHLEIIPVLSHVAGFEWGSGFFINPLPPEEAALALRESGDSC